jgi:POT family proton-dependent oligopeptide transporter
LRVIHEGSHDDQHRPRCSAYRRTRQGLAAGACHDFLHRDVERWLLRHVRYWCCTWSTHWLRTSKALTLYGIYTGLVYLTPIIGGYLADRYLQRRKAVLIGGITMALGHFAMAFPPLLHLALGLLIIGNGFFKPNMSTLLGALYREHDPRRDGGFTIYYMGVNLGAFLSPLIAGTLGEKVGWHWGFASAGVGMCLGLAQFVYGQHKLGNAGLPKGKDRLDGRDWLEVLAISLAAIPAVYLAMALWSVVGPLWSVVPTSLSISLPVVLLIGLLFYIRRSCPVEEFHGSIAIMIMGLFVVLFGWVSSRQGHHELVCRQANRPPVFGWEIPATYFKPSIPSPSWRWGRSFRRSGPGSINPATRCLRRPRWRWG